MTQKEQKNPIKNLLASAEAFVYAVMNRSTCRIWPNAGKKSKLKTCQNSLSDETRQNLRNKFKELREEDKKLYRYLWRAGDKKSY